jgi:23S rRNA pseudouridine1911/1915/1917 synthase
MFKWQDLEILCEDGAVLAVNKPSGIISQGAPEGVISLIDLVKDYIRHKYDKPGNVYLGVIHRLDRPVSGVVVFSRNSKCAARLAEQFRERDIQKVYLAIVEGFPNPQEGQLVDWLIRQEEHDTVQIVKETTPGARRSSLSYRTLARQGQYTLLQVHLETGRMHQIRVQLASRGWPIIGDYRYGAKTALTNQFQNEPRAAPIALHAYRLTFKHPIRYDELTVTASFPPAWKKLGFRMDQISLD